MGDRLLSSAVTGKNCTLCVRKCRTPAQYWIKIVHPWVQKLYPVLGLGSGGRLLRGFQTPVLYWIDFSLQFFTLTAPQNNFVNTFFVFAWEFCIEKWRGFLVNFFLVSVSHETKHENSSKNSGKIRSKIRGKIQDENSKNSGSIRSAAFLT